MSAEPNEIVRWMLMEAEHGLPMIVLVVDDRHDDAFVSVVARANDVPSQQFSGHWDGRHSEDAWLLAFHLVEHGGGLERTWQTDSLHRDLLEAVAEVPHLVTLIPEEIAGEVRTPREVLVRLGSALAVKVDRRSPVVAEVLAGLGD